MLRLCAEHLTEGAEHQSVAVLGIALVVLGEDVGTEMSLRTFDHLLQVRPPRLLSRPLSDSLSRPLSRPLSMPFFSTLEALSPLTLRFHVDRVSSPPICAAPLPAPCFVQYGELPVKRVVPLALALLYVSNPDYSVIDQVTCTHTEASPPPRSLRRTPRQHRRLATPFISDADTHPPSLTSLFPSSFTLRVWRGAAVAPEPRPGPRAGHGGHPRPRHRLRRLQQLARRGPPTPTQVRVC